MKDAYSGLLSGTDVRGVAVATEEGPATLDEAAGRRIGAAFARWLSARAGKPCADLRVAVGRDSRVTGEALAAAMAQGLGAQGARVLDCGLCTTPAMFMTTVLMAADGAVMVTASHLPWQRNGYKFFSAGGGLEAGDVKEILDGAARTGADDAGAGDAGVGGAQAGPEAVDFLSIYTGHLRERITSRLGEGEPLAGMRIAVDAGHGAGGFYARLLASLGADTSGSVCLEPDGRFPGHAPNPEDPDAMAAISRAVLAAGADLGVIFDADCDRAAMVDAAGRPINRNRLIALVSAILLRETPGATVVTDSVTSAGLEAFIAARGGRQHRYRRGYRNVIDEAIRLNAQGVDCPLAIETSGHAALRENYFLDDGMYLMTRLIIAARRMQLDGQSLFALLDGLVEPVEEAEVRVRITAADFRAAGERTLAALTAMAGESADLRIDPENREGLRVQLGGSPQEWAMVRQSLHDPMLVINAESQREGGVRAMLARLYGMLEGMAGLELSALRGRAAEDK